MSDSFEIANRVLPYQYVAQKPFSLGWSLGTSDDSDVWSPQDVSGVADIRVSLQQQVARGVTAPAAVIYTLLGGQISLSTETIDGQSFPLVSVTDEVGQAAGTYDLILSLIGNGIGLVDLVLTASVEFILQP